MHTTTKTTFFPSGGNANLLAVNGGIPVMDAVQAVNCLVNSAQAVTALITEDGRSNPSALYGARYLMEMAQAIIKATNPQGGAQ